MRHNHVLGGLSKPPGFETLGVKGLTLSSHSCWGTSTPGDEVENRLKHFSENLVPICNPKLNIPEVELFSGNVTMVNNSLSSSHAALAASVSNTAMSNAPAFSGGSTSVLTKRDVVTVPNALLAKDFTSSHAWPVVSKSSPTGVLLPNVNRSLPKVMKEPKQVVVVGGLTTNSVSDSTMLSVQPTRQQQKRSSVHENYLPGSGDSSLQDVQKNALLKRPRVQSVANPELVSILSEPLPGEGPPVKRTHLEKQEPEVGIASEPSSARLGPAAGKSNSQLAGNGKTPDGMIRPPSKSSSASVDDVEDLVRLEEQLQQVTQTSRNANVARQDSNASSKSGLPKDLDVKTENCGPEFCQRLDSQPAADQKSVVDEKPSISQKPASVQKPALDQKPCLDQKPSPDQKPVVDQKSESPAVAPFDFPKGISNKANEETKSVISVKVEATDIIEKASAPPPPKLPPTNGDEDKPPIKVILNRRTLQGENLYQMNDHGFWKEKPRDRKLAHSVKSSPSMPEYVVDLSADTEVDSLTCGGVVAAASVKVGAGRSSASPQVSKSIDRKDGARTTKRPKTSRTSSEPGEKRAKREDGKKSSKKKKVSDDDDDSIADDTSSTSSSIHPMERITTIKITNSGGKLQIQNPVKEVLAVNVTGGKSPTVVVRNSATPTPTTAAQKMSKLTPSSVTLIPPTKLNRPAILASRVPNRSRSESVGGASGGGGASASGGGTDLKLNKTPTVKLKQLAVVTSRPGVVSSGMMTPHVVKGSTQMSKSGGFSGGLIATPANRSRATPASIDAKLARKGSLSSVIDTLMKKQHSGSSSPGSNREGHVVSQKKILDAIRIQIIREGNKPSAPTRELGTNSIKSSSSISQTMMRKSDSGKVDPLKATEIANRVVQTTQASLPKLLMPAKPMPNGMLAKNSVSLGPVTPLTSYRSTAPSSSEKSQILDSSVIFSKPPKEPVSVVPTIDTIRSYELPVTTCKPSCISGTPTAPSASMPLVTLPPHMRPVCDVGRMRPPFLPALPTPPLPFVSPTNVSPAVRMMPPVGNAGGMRGPPVPVTSPFSGKPVQQAGSPVPGHSSKLNEITDRLARRHFTDVVTPVDESGGCHERYFSPPRSPSPVDENARSAADSRGGTFLAQDGPPKVIDFFADVEGNSGSSGDSAKDPAASSDGSSGVSFRIANHLVKSTPPVVDLETDSSNIPENAKQNHSSSSSTRRELKQGECPPSSKSVQSLNTPTTSAATEHKAQPSAADTSTTVSPPLSSSWSTESQENPAGGSKVNPLHPEVQPAASPAVLESSSPGDGLLIDYPSSPKAMLQTPPQPNGTMPESPSKQARLSADIITLSPSPQKHSPPSWCSAIKSPSLHQNSQSSPTSSNGACNSDDDLMDVALTL